MDELIKSIDEFVLRTKNTEITRCGTWFSQVMRSYIDWKNGDTRALTDYLETLPTSPKRWAGLSGEPIYPSIIVQRIAVRFINLEIKNAGISQ